jgi:hypothetical protein
VLLALYAFKKINFMKKNLLFIFLFAVTASILSCGEPTPEKADAVENKTEAESKEPAAKPASNTIVNLSSISGKTLAEVEAVLGKAESTEKASPSGTPCKENPCDKAFFQSGKYEIVFINGKADWITINNLSEYTLSETNIELLGFTLTPPVSSNTTVIRWEDVDGIGQVSFFNNGSGKIDYANIKVATK